MDKVTEAFKAHNKKQRENGNPQISFSNFMRMRQGSYKPKSTGLYTTGLIRKSPVVPSGDGFGRDASKKREQHYTGANLLGIATMHKSNSVPVFRKEDAIDIANMRRN